MNWWYMPLNSAGVTSADWVATSDPTGVPPQAAAHGFSTLTYGPHVTLGTNWWPWLGDNSAQGLVQNSDGSVTDQGGKGNSYNAHVVSTSSNGTNFSHGVLFGGGGYFECTFRFDGDGPGWGTPQAADGWPSWWCSDPGTGNAPIHVEIDWFEWFCNAGSVNLPPNSIGGTNTAFNSGMIDWYGSGQWMGSGSVGYNDSAYAPSTNDPSQYHKVGGLWVPATQSSDGMSCVYFDDVQVGPVHTWKPYNGGSTPEGVGGTAPNFSSLDVSKIVLLWGTGSNNPMTVSAINVWQRDDSQNIRRGV
jgi:hypothetical protein